MKDFGKKIIRLIDGLIDKSVLLVCIVLFLLAVSFGILGNSIAEGFTYLICLKKIFRKNDMICVFLAY